MLSYNILYKFISITIIFVLVALVSGIGLEAKAKKERVRMKMYYSKDDTGDRLISLTLTTGSGRKMHGLKNATISLSSVLNDTTIVLATLETDTMGMVELYLAVDYQLPVYEDGKSVIVAKYEGDEVYRSVSKELDVSDLEFDFAFKVEDSVKYLSVMARKIDKEGNRLPVEGLDVKVGLQRLYSILPIEEVETDEEGIGTVEIPNDLPGDAEGMLTFVASIEDNDEFGTVTKFVDQEGWGLQVSYEIKPLPRQLYTDEAPLWMIVTVVVFLVGAWYHFFLSISKLIKLKKAA